MAGFSVKKPLTVFVAVLGIIVLGVVAYLKMTPDLLPNMDFPYVIIVTSDPGASPESVEQTITKPMEQSMSTLDKIKDVTSTSQNSVSMVLLEFEDGVNMDTVSVDIQQKISVLQGSWEDTVSAPYVLKINPSMLPVMVAAVSREDMDVYELSDFVTDELSGKLEGVSGVASISVSGAVTREAHVILDEKKLDALSEKLAEAVKKQLGKAESQLLSAKKEVEKGQAALASAKKAMADGIVTAPGKAADAAAKELEKLIEALKKGGFGGIIDGSDPDKALEELLNQLKSGSANENTISCEFAEDVEIKQEYVPTDKVMNLGYLAELLYSTKTAEVTYTVKAGDTWSEIAEDHDMTSKELLAMNPGYDIDKIQIGEVLTLSEAVPYLTVTVKQREYYVEDVMYDIEYTDSADLYKGDYKVVSSGEYGAADVVANVTYVNGVETERTILSSVTLKEPVTEQRLQGTKERPTWYPTGTFRWPISGRITSGFGGRSSPGGIGSTNHKGTDIGRVGYTSPIYASKAGTVIVSQYSSSYGNYVVISHGSGNTTLYAHMSSRKVSVGQYVNQGDVIGITGSTGNSTGPHLHFEVTENGVRVNPLNDGAEPKMGYLTGYTLSKSA